MRWWGCGLLGPQSGRLFEIMEGFGILPGGLIFLREPEGGARKADPSLLNPCVLSWCARTKSLIRREIFAKFKQRGPRRGSSPEINRAIAGRC